MPSKIDQTDWLAAQFQELPSIEAGGFFIYGSHHNCPIPQNKICLKIDTPYAFGSGHHPTTANCLKMMEELANNQFLLKKGLDIGCGSGILSFGMAALWKQSKIFGCDYDKDSVQTAKTNAKLNKFNKIEFVLSDGLAHPSLSKNGLYDLIAANIHLNSLCELAPQLPKILSKHGKVILSGILEEQKDELVRQYHDHKIHLEKCCIEEGWCALLLSKI